MLGEDDRRQLAFALAEGRALVTHDNDHLRLHAQGVPHAGVIYRHRHKYRMGDLIRRLEEIWERIEPEDMIATIEYL